MKNEYPEIGLPAEDDFPKLVRDKIPEISEKRSGRKTKMKIMKKDSEFLKYVLKKLEEELSELIYFAKDRKKVSEEIADIFELLDVLMKLKKLSKKDIQNVRKAKNKRAGAFKKRILMFEKNF